MYIYTIFSKCDAIHHYKKISDGPFPLVLHVKGNRAVSFRFLSQECIVFALCIK